MEVRHPVHPEHMLMFDTDEMRHHFLVQGLFVPSQSKLVYCFYDRLIVGGVCPVGPVTLAVDPKIIGAEFLLERRELGIINIGESGRVVADGTRFDLGRGEGLYVGPYPSAADGGLSVLRYAGGCGGFSSYGRTGRDQAPGGARGRGGAVAFLVHPFRGRDGQLYLHLGHGRRESELQ